MTKEAYKLLHYGVLALARAERQGIRVDLDFAYAKEKELTEMIEEETDKFMQTKFCREWVRSLGHKKININSDPQLSTYLYKTKKLKPHKLTASGQGSTEETALESLNIKELNILLHARKLKKLRDTYLAQFFRETVDGHIHPFYNLHIPVTYRSSSDQPNFQNMPIRDPYAKAIIRGCLHARPNHQLLEIDFGNLEVRIATCYHEDPTMIKYIEDPKSNMHTDMAKQIYFINKLDPENVEGHNTLRQSAKNSFVFPQFYGDYYANNVEGLSRWVKLSTRTRWKDCDGIELDKGVYVGEHMRKNGVKSNRDFLDHMRDIEDHFWTERFPVYNKWKERWWRKYQKNGYFDMFTGFRCSGIMTRNDVINYPVQGAAFHCLLWSLIQLDRIMVKENWDTKIVGQIHDSILFDLHPDELQMVLDYVKKVTTIDLPNEWKWIIVPLEVDYEICKVDQSWNHKKKIEMVA